MNWFTTMCDSLRTKLDMALSLHNGDKAAAIEYVRSNSTAGWKVWEEVLRTF